jgi:hypothetical protein
MAILPKQQKFERVEGNPGLQLPFENLEGKIK